MTDFISRPAQVVDSTTAGDQTFAITTELANGGHMVAWTSNASGEPVVMAQAFDASGAKSGAELTLARGYTAGGIAMLADGSIVVSLTQNGIDAGSGPTSAVSFAKFDAAGHAIGAPALVDGGGNYDTWLSADDTWLSAGETFALPGGGFAIVETSTSRPTPVSTVDNVIREFDAAGNLVRTIDAGENYLSQLGIDEMRGGGFVTAEFPYTGPGPFIVKWHALDATGAQTAGAQLNGAYSSFDYATPSVVALGDGSAYVTWQYRDYTNNTSTWQAQHIDASGHATGAAFTWNYAGSAAPQLTAMAGGGFLATWIDGSSQLDAQTFDANAQSTSAVQHLAAMGGNASPALTHYEITATNDGGFILDYQASGDGIDIYEQKFDALAAASSGAMPVNADSIDLAGSHTQYAVASGSITGPGGTVSLAGIDRVHFADGFALAFDVSGDAGEAYRIYQAAFDRTPDLPGLGYHINDLDHGVPLSLVAQHFIDSPEFQATYGATTDTQFITLLYQNVLNRAPDAGGLQFHLDEFAHGESRADMLTHFSESPENEANVIGQISNGMLYVEHA